MVPQPTPCWHVLDSPCEKGNLEVVKLLVEHGSNVNTESFDIESNKWRTPLGVAAVHRHFEVVKYLVTHGANVNCLGAALSALIMACKGGSLEIVQHLVENGASTDGLLGLRAVNEALEQDCCDILEYLLDQTLVASDSGENYIVSRPLLTYAKRLRALQVLVEHGADPNLPDEEQWTPLHNLCYIDGTIDGIRMLVEHGTKVNSRNLIGETALHILLERQREPSLEAIRYLVETAGADPLAFDDNGENCLHKTKHSAVVAVYLLNSRGLQGMSTRSGSTSSLHERRSSNCYAGPWRRPEHG